MRIIREISLVLRILDTCHCDEMGNHRYMCLWYIFSWAKYGCEEKIYRRKVVLVPYRARVNKIERERERREFFLSASGAYIVIFRSLTLQASLTTGIPCIWRWEKRLTMLDAMRDRPRFRPHVSLPTSLSFSTPLTMKYIKKCTAKDPSTKASANLRRISLNEKLFFHHFSGKFEEKGQIIKILRLIKILKKMLIFWILIGINFSVIMIFRFERLSLTFCEKECFRNK